MGFVKDLYLEEVERLQADLEAQGMDPADAYDIASEHAYEAMKDRLADMADQARTQRKEQS